MMNNISEEQKKEFLEEILEFLKFPSISADSNYKDDLNKTANWVSKSLIKAGCDSSEVIKTKGHPIVYGEKIINEEAIIWNSRRNLLREVMNKFGFAQHPNEWWHFSYGDQLWAWKNKKANALYGKI